MEFITKLTCALTEKEIEAINHVASRGFGGMAPQTMRADTVNHLAAADMIQQVQEGEVLQAFALYRSCLWRTCD